MRSVMSDDGYGSETANLVMGCVDAHQKTAPAASRSTVYRMFDYCTCGWKGFPFDDHQRLMIYTAILRAAQPNHRESSPL